MDFTFTPEQDALREQARDFLAANPEPTWAALAELGWTGVSVAEEDGGAGLTFVEEAVLFEELGRALYHGPFFSTVALALPALPEELRSEVAALEEQRRAAVEVDPERFAETQVAPVRGGVALLRQELVWVY